MKSYSHPREAAVAGMFYPRSAHELKENIKQLFSQVPPGSSKGRLCGLVIPHAGYMYSGLTAAYGYSQVAKMRFDAVIIISPSHREYFDGISIYDGSAYQTPLGTIQVDAQIRDLLVGNQKHISADIVGHREEHAVEVHLPFLQYLQCTEKFLPVVMGDQRSEYCAALAMQLADVLHNRNCLIIASSDLSHYHSYDEANALDQVTIDDIAEFDFAKLTKDLESGRTEACGGGPITVMLQTARLLGATEARIFHHCNSGDITGERDAVVGYLSAGVFFLP